MKIKRLIGVAALGAGLAYLFDPARGGERRQRIGGAVRDFLGQTEEAADEAGSTVERAAETTEHVAARGREAATNVGEAATGPPESAPASRTPGSGNG